MDRFASAILSFLTNPSSIIAISGAVWHAYIWWTNRAFDHQVRWCLINNDEKEFRKIYHQGRFLSVEDGTNLYRTAKIRGVTWIMDPILATCNIKAEELVSNVFKPKHD